jgi:CRISPR-associated protein Cas6
MIWQEETDAEHYVVPDDVVDLMFDVDCKSLPVDHPYSLCEAVKRALPWFADDPQVALHQIHVAESGNGWERPSEAKALLHPSRRTKLILRLPKERVADAEALSGQRLDIDGNPLTLGRAKLRKLAKTTTVYARYVVAQSGEDENEFLRKIVEQLNSEGFRIKKALCGKETHFSHPDGVIATRSVMITELPYEDAVRLQERGMGRAEEKKMGFGLFIPHKSV